MPLTPTTGGTVEEGRGRQISEFKASLIYRMSSRTARLHKETLSPNAPPPNQKKKCSAELEKWFSS